MAGLSEVTDHRHDRRVHRAAHTMPPGGRERTEFAALVLAMTAFTTGPVYVVAVRVFSAPGTWEDGWIKYSFIVSAMLGCATWASMALDGRLRRPAVALWIAGAYTTLAVLSTYWSVLAYYTLWRSLTYCGLLATAWALASLHYRRLVALLLTFSGLGVALSIVAVFARPEVGRDGTGVWRGIYTNPNSLGPICALAIVAMVALALESRSDRVRTASTIGAAATCVPMIGSGSSTAVVALLASSAMATVAVTAAVLWQRGERRRAALVAGFSGLAALVGTTVLVRSGAFASIALRAEVWDVVWDRIRIKPWGGYGFFTYWDTNASLSPRTLARAGSAHNSALDAALGVGFAGSLLVVWLAGLAVLRAVRDALTAPTARTWTWMTLTVFVVLAHVTESFVSWFSYMWILLIVLAWGRPTAEEP